MDIHETNGFDLRDQRAKIAKRLDREGWIVRHGGNHDIYTHAGKTGVRVVVPRHRVLSPGVARNIAVAAGWV